MMSSPSNDPELEDALDHVDDLLNDEEYEKAYDVLTALRERYPDSAEVAGMHALSLFWVDRLEEMSVAYREAMRRWPDDYELPYGFANCLLDLGCPDEAEEYFKRALAVVPKADKTHASDIATDLGTALLQQAKQVEAFAAWRQALELDAENDTARDLLEIYANAGDAPASFTPIFDDLHIFQRIQIARYREMIGGEEFESDEDVNLVFGLLMEAWNKHIAPLGARLDALSPAEKRVIFAAVHIDFPMPGGAKKKPAKKKSASVKKKKGRKK